MHLYSNTGKPRMKTLNILGGGLYGCLLSTAIARQLKANSAEANIKILERGKEILSSWNSINIGGQKFNGGFYGIEVPRAKQAMELMSPGISKQDLKSMTNFKLLYIEDNLIPFRYPRKYWPNDLSEGIPYKNPGDEWDIDTDLRFRNSLLGRVIMQISKRYADEIEDCWHLLYPWFFPYENNFMGDDEGYQIQQEAMSGESGSYYLVPRHGLFEKLKKPLEKNLVSEQIEVNKNWKPADLENFLNSSTKETTNIWTASAPSLARALNINIESEWNGGKRYFYIMALKTEKKCLKELKQRYGKFPSEILYATTRATELARVSFYPNHIETIGEDNNEIFVVAEIFSQEKILTSDSRESIKATIEDSLAIGPTTCIGVTDSRRFDVASPKKIKQAEEELVEKVKPYNLETPYLYWWPINMAKCGISAYKDSNEIAKMAMQ